MAAAMARGLRDHGGHPEMVFTDAGSGRAAVLAAETGGSATESLGDLAEASDVIVLALKPRALADASSELQSFTGPLVSLLGATTTSQLRDAFPSASVLRAMPNVAVEVGRGVICHAPPSDPERFTAVLDLLGRLGHLFELTEEQIDPATAVMGCAPAYLALACEAISAAGSEAGLGTELSGRLVGLAAAGIGELLVDHDPAALQTAIASPGGSTEAGLDALTERGAPQAFKAAVEASLQRMAGVA